MRVFIQIPKGQRVFRRRRRPYGKAIGEDVVKMMLGTKNVAAGSSK